MDKIDLLELESVGQAGMFDHQGVVVLVACILIIVGAIIFYFRGD